MNCCFPKTNHCEWWNINTHRCNHIGRPPVSYERYGLGRAQVGDWGRVGCVNITQHKGVVKVTPQISNDLATALHSSTVPAALLPPHYLFADQPACCTSARPARPYQEDHFDAHISRDFGFADLLHDPVMEEQASAAYLCGKLHGMLRRNTTLRSLERRPGGAVGACDCLKQICSLAIRGLTVETDDEQQCIIDSIHALVYPDLEKPATSRNVRPARFIPCLPQSVANILTRPPKARDSGTDDRRLLAAFDPLLLHLACRPVNWNYVGKGLLCSPRQTFLGQSILPDRLLLWSPPIPPCSNCPPGLYMAKLERDTSIADHHRLSFPSSLALGCNPFELDAFFDTDKGLNVVTRWNAIRANAARLHLTVDELQPSGYIIDGVFQPPLSSPATSVCASPWIPGEWAVAGTRFESGTGGRSAFVHLYPPVCDTNRTGALWKGRLPLEMFEETFARDCKSVLSASTGASDLDDVIQAEMKEYLRTCPSLLRPSGQPNFTPFGTRCSLNFSGYPGELYLTTSRRIFAFDTRQHSDAHEVFSLSSDRFANGREKTFSLFNEADQLTLSCPRLIGEVYLLLGSLHSFALVDRRMPGRCVLHWSHGLISAPCYSDWTVCSSDSVENPSPPGSLSPHSVLPQVLLCTGSQFPPVGMNLIGLNVTSRDSGAQLVGPSLSGAPLRRMVFQMAPDGIPAGDNGFIPVGILANQLVSQRTEASLCGLVMPESDNVCAVSLTSTGDLFVHSWHRSAEEARRVDRRNACSAMDWMCDLRTNGCVSIGQGEQSDVSNGAAVVDLDQVGRLSDDDGDISHDGGPRPTCWWAMNEVAPSTDWPGLMKTSSSVADQLFTDLCINWQQAGMPYPNLAAFPPRLTEARQQEEARRQKELDELSLAVTYRLRRLKQLVHYALPVDDLPPVTALTTPSTLRARTGSRRQDAKRRRIDLNEFGCDG